MGGDCDTADGGSCGGRDGGGDDGRSGDGGDGNMSERCLVSGKDGMVAVMEVELLMGEVVVSDGVVMVQYMEVVVAEEVRMGRVMIVVEVTVVVVKVNDSPRRSNGKDDSGSGNGENAAG